MTVDEAIQLANDGNVNAMQGLASYYMDCEDIEESEKWTYCAAEANYLPCIIAAVSAAKMDANTNELLELYTNCLSLRTERLTLSLRSKRVMKAPHLNTKARSLQPNVMGTT